MDGNSEYKDASVHEGSSLLDVIKVEIKEELLSDDDYYEEENYGDEWGESGEQSQSQVAFQPEESPLLDTIKVKIKEEIFSEEDNYVEGWKGGASTEGEEVKSPKSPASELLQQAVASVSNRIMYSIYNNSYDLNTEKRDTVLLHDGSDTKKTEHKTCFVDDDDKLTETLETPFAKLILATNKIYQRPNCSYSFLIALALKNSRFGTLGVAEIYHFICDNFPYFATTELKWRRGIRHCLTSSRLYRRVDVLNSCKKKGTWSLNPLHIADVDRLISKILSKNYFEILEATSYPEFFELLINGELKNEEDPVIDLKFNLKEKETLTKCEVVQEEVEKEVKEEEEEIIEKELSVTGKLEETLAISENYFTCNICKNVCQLLDSSIPQKLKIICDTCYKNNKIKAKSEWKSRKFECYETCLVCLNLFYNNLDIVLHDCQNEKFYSCDVCRIILVKKEDLARHSGHCREKYECFNSQTQDITVDVNKIINKSAEFLNSQTQDITVDENQIINKSAGAIRGAGEGKKIHKHNIYLEHNYSYIINSDTVSEQETNNCCHCDVFQSSSVSIEHFFHPSKNHSIEKPFNKPNEITYFICKYCGKSCDKIKNFIDHVETHSEEEIQICRERNQSNISNYVVTVTKIADKNSNLKNENKSLPYQNNKKVNHLDNHSVKNLKVCDVCKKLNKTLVGLKLNMKVHVKRFSCEKCKRSFIRAGNLKRHLKIH